MNVQWSPTRPLIREKPLNPDAPPTDGYRLDEPSSPKTSSLLHFSSFCTSKNNQHQFHLFFFSHFNYRAKLKIWLLSEFEECNRVTLFIVFVFNVDQSHDGTETFDWCSEAAVCPTDQSESPSSETKVPLGGFTHSAFQTLCDVTKGLTRLFLFSCEDKRQVFIRRL